MGIGQEGILQGCLQVNSKLQKQDRGGWRGEVEPSRALQAPRRRAGHAHKPTAHGEKGYSTQCYEGAVLRDRSTPRGVREGLWGPPDDKVTSSEGGEGGPTALTPPAPGRWAGDQGAAGRRLGGTGLNRTPSGSSPISQQKQAG